MKRENEDNESRTTGPEMRNRNDRMINTMAASLLSQLCSRHHFNVTLWPQLHHKIHRIIVSLCTLIKWLLIPKWNSQASMNRMTKRHDGLMQDAYNI